jgi:hypothetical protein
VRASGAHRRIFAALFRYLFKRFYSDSSVLNVKSVVVFCFRLWISVSNYPARGRSAGSDSFLWSAEGVLLSFEAVFGFRGLDKLYLITNRGIKFRGYRPQHRI